MAGKTEGESVGQDLNNGHLSIEADSMGFMHGNL